MTYLYYDYNSGKQCRILSDSKEDAIIIVIKNMLKNKDIDVDSICTDLDISLIDLNDLPVYE